MNQIYFKYYKLSKYKFLEFEIFYQEKFINYFNFSVEWSKRTDHPGFKLNIDILNLSLYLNIIDNRHWNYKLDKYE